MRKLFQKKPNEPTNPDGLTFSQFLEKYPESKHLAFLCWFAGCYPEDMMRELKKLMEVMDHESV